MESRARAFRAPWGSPGLPGRPQALPGHPWAHGVRPGHQKFTPGPLGCAPELPKFTLGLLGCAPNSPPGAWDPRGEIIIRSI